MSVQSATSQRQSDEELIASFQEGRVEAFNILVGRYKHPLINFVYRYVGDYAEADDVVQETFIRVYQKKHSYQPIAKFSTWIYTIATNLAKTQLRRRHRRALVSLSSRRNERGDRDFELPDRSRPVDAEANRVFQREFLEKALAALPEKYREVVILFDIQELSYEEICSITGLNMGTLKSRLNRGRTQLQKFLSSMIDERELRS